MIITTSYRLNARILSITKNLEEHYNLTYVERKKLTLPKLLQIYNCPVIIVSESRIVFATEKGQIYFHPNLAQVRSKRIESGQNDTMVTVSGLKRGMRFLDCTMGLGADSLIASQVVGDTGEVVALESSPAIHMIVKEGMRYYPFKNEVLAKAASRINFEHADYYDYLRQAKDNEFDVVYFDPMFDSDIKEDTPLEMLQSVADYSKLNLKVISEAKRVAKNCVIMKNHYASNHFEALGFIQIKRKTSQFHYGIINVEN